MSKKIKEEHRECPFCGKTIFGTSLSMGKNVEYCLTKRGIRIWFHRSCYLKNTRGYCNED